jgi:oxalate decarboxylase/phosphoglucose isomerase-like protein (cupin superfamily)
MNNKLDLSTIPFVPTTLNNKYGLAQSISQKNFPVLEEITSYHLEIYHDSMRTVHLHTNCNELGFLLSGKIQVLIYFDEKIPTVFTVLPGNLWFIPKGFPHSLNNIGTETSEMFVGFSNATPDNIDISVMIGSMPNILKNSYKPGSSIHSLLVDFIPPTSNYIYCPLPENAKRIKDIEDSPYYFDLNMFMGNSMYKIVNSKTWPILTNKGISLGKFSFKPLQQSETLFTPGSVCLYIILNGKLDIFTPEKTSLTKHNYYFVPNSMIHTAINPCDKELCEFIVFFSDGEKMLTLQNTLNFFGEELSSYNLVNKYFIPEIMIQK